MSAWVGLHMQQSLGTLDPREGGRRAELHLKQRAFPRSPRKERLIPVRRDALMNAELRPDKVGLLS